MLDIETPLEGGLFNAGPDRGLRGRPVLRGAGHVSDTLVARAGETSRFHIVGAGLGEPGLLRRRFGGRNRGVPIPETPDARVLRGVTVAPMTSRAMSRMRPLFAGGACCR
jgi:hypothetical protein